MHLCLCYTVITVKTKELEICMVCWADSDFSAKNSILLQRKKNVHLIRYLDKKAIVTKKKLRSVSRLSDAYSSSTRCYKRMEDAHTCREKAAYQPPDHRDIIFLRYSWIEDHSQDSCIS
jgi:hypothetical protein